MAFTRRALMASVVLLAVGGCEHHHHEEPHAVVVPVYEPGYYDRGYYAGDDWYWHDRGGREFHEARVEHERRMRDWGGREGERGDRAEQGDRERR